jgi:hypothetical protein
MNGWMYIYTWAYRLIDWSVYPSLPMSVDWYVCLSMYMCVYIEPSLHHLMGRADNRMSTADRVHRSVSPRKHVQG